MKKTTGKIFGSWYRGSYRKDNIKKRYTYWTNDRPEAVAYAKERHGIFFRMKLDPTPLEKRKVIMGSNPELIEKFHIKRKYMKLVGQSIKEQERGKINKSTATFRKADALPDLEAKKRGYQIRVIAADQIVVYDPRLIKIANKRIIGKKEGK